MDREVNWTLTLIVGGHEAQTLSLRASRILAGTGAHCDVRLPVEFGEHETILFEALGERILARRLSKSPIRINGNPLDAAHVMPTDDIVIGLLHLRVRSTVESAGKPAARSRWRLGLLLVALVAVSAVVSNRRPESVITLGIAPIPKALWSEAPAACPQKSGDLAAGTASELRAMADSRRNRAPFQPQDGVLAVSLYRQAGACFRQAGDSRRAEEVDAGAGALGRKVQDEFRFARLLLDLSLSTEDWGGARRATTRLRAFVRGTSGEFPVWLATVDRELQSKISAPSEL